jgi:hypothetical protein
MEPDGSVKNQGFYTRKNQLVLDGNAYTGPLKIINADSTCIIDVSPPGAAKIH